jgi:dTDP-4-dehydrorhamnose reductase
MKSQGNKMIIFGSSGLVGSAIAEGLRDSYSLLTPTHGEVDVTNQQQVTGYITRVRPDYIIYAAGLARVDACQESPRRALALNATAPGFIAHTGVPTMYISTDAVFDGKPRAHPYTEDDIPNPFSVYGETKLQGEEAVRTASDKNIILRIVTAFTYRKHMRSDFMRRAVETLLQHKPYPAISDQQVSPLLLPLLPQAIDAIISTRQTGTFHLGSTDSATNFEIISMVARKFGFDRSLVRPVTLIAYLREKSAKRARYCVLDTSKFQRLVSRGILPDIETSIQTFFKNYEHS